MKKVLVLDDNEDILSIVEEVLFYEHFRVRGLRSTARLLAEAESFRPDLILLDFKLADGNGGELCRMFKTHAEFKDLPVIIFSAYSQPGLDLMQFGCDAVIAKPFDLVELTETIQSLLATNGKPVTE